MNLFRGLIFAISFILVGCVSGPHFPSPEISYTIPQQLSDITVSMNTLTAEVESRFTGVLIVHQNTVYVLSVAHGVAVRAGSVEGLFTVTLPACVLGRREYRCTVIKCDPNFRNNGWDLSLCRVEGLSPDLVHSTQLANKNPELGQELQTVGNPTVAIENSINELPWMYSKTLVSKTKLYIAGNSNPAFCITSTAFPGQSGSGVFDSSGRLVGLIQGVLGGTYSTCIGVEEIAQWSKGSDIEEIIAGSILH